MDKIKIDLLSEQSQIVELFKTIKNLTEGQPWKYSKSTLIADGRVIIYLKIEKKLDK